MSITCGICSGYGMWAWAIGNEVPMGEMDAQDGFPTQPCPECGANANPTEERHDFLDEMIEESIKRNSGFLLLLQKRKKESIQERFEAWIERHPDVYEEFKCIAESLRSKRARYGAKAIMEVIRFHRVMSGQDEYEPFKVNNIYSSRLARKLMEEDSRFIGFFETRELRTE